MPRCNGLSICGTNTKWCFSVIRNSRRHNTSPSAAALANWNCTCAKIAAGQVITNCLWPPKKRYYRQRNAGPRKAPTPEREARTPDVEHPIVRTHPFNGKKCLSVNEGYTARIAGMVGPEGDALLHELITHSTRPEFIYQHSWRVGDFLLWDNCLVQHQAIPDYPLPRRRPMARTTLTGSAPF
jgi:alpha-ketoglutarate-dependent taurine dioxygenase